MIEGETTLCRALLWRLGAPTLPRVAATHLLAHLAKRAAMATARRLFGPDRIPECISGHPVERRKGNPHARWLPYDRDGDGHLDHLLVYAQGGLCSASMLALAACHRLYEAPATDIALEVVALSTQAERASGLCGPSRYWRSLTPCIRGDRFDNSGVDLQGRLQDELRCAGFPPAAGTPAALATDPFIRLADRPLPRNPFSHRPSAGSIGVVVPDNSGKPLWGHAWTLTFPEPLQQPLALGWESHFGFGLFRPDDGPERL